MPSGHQVMPPYPLRWCWGCLTHREPGLLLLPVFPGSRGETRSSAVGQTASSSSGQVQQAHVQLPGGESLASPGATPAPFGKTPRAVFCLCFPA